MEAQLGRFLLRYLVFIGIPYLVGKRIEKYMWHRLNPEIKQRLNKELKKLPKIENISDETRNALDNRGGAGPGVLVWLTKLIVVDFGLKSAIAGGIFATIWSGNADTAAGQIAKYGSAILTAPGHKFKNLYKRLKRLKGLNPQHTQDIREILLDRELDDMDKLELLKIKIRQAFKELRGPKRKEFILFVLALLLFSLGGNTTAFCWFLHRLKALLGTGTDDEDNLRNALIQVYWEYNAPLPKELVENLPAEILQSIRSLE
jgi:hypothetical protein